MVKVTYTAEVVSRYLIQDFSLYINGEFLMLYSCSAALVDAVEERIKEYAEVSLVDALGGLGKAGGLKRAVYQWRIAHG